MKRHLCSTMKGTSCTFLKTRGMILLPKICLRTRMLNRHCSVIMNIINMQRHEPYWGPDAHIFDPDRWLDSRVQRYVSNPFIFVPFNAGPRIVSHGVNQFEQLLIFLCYNSCKLLHYHYPSFLRASTN